MSQLKMLFLAEETPLPPLPAVPEGFILRTLTASEEDTKAYLRLRPEGGFSEWTPEQLDGLRKKALKQGIQVVTPMDGLRIIASASAETTDYPSHPELGTLGWVMASEDYRGLGLGKLASVAAMRRGVLEGYKILKLSTDDFRIPALSMYLKLGWRPWLLEDDMPGRWQAICEKLGFNYGTLPKVEKLALGYIP